MSLSVKSLFSAIHPEHSFFQCVLFKCSVSCGDVTSDFNRIFAGNQNLKLGKGTDLNYWQLEFFYKKYLLPVVSSLDGLG